MSAAPTLKAIVDECGDLIFPIIIRGSKVVVFRICEGDSPHVFGGELPSYIKIPSRSIIHNVASIDTSVCDILSDINHSVLHLLYAFRHDGEGAKYKIKGSSIKVGRVSPRKPDEDWPYEGFPNFFEKKFLEVWGVIQADDHAIEALLHQHVDISNSNLVVAVVPPSKDYGVSLWGEHGDAEMVQCIFEYDLSKEKVSTYNICG